ncbi:putative lipid II flippase FtsW [Candidatus Gracilibacteria bacterium]|nr:putative lipid II flippase FtsW [Candidatus Gracilibacteria bacterium]
MKFLQNIDRPLFYSIIGLSIFGLIMIGSVSIYESYLLTSKLVGTGLIDEISNSFYLKRAFFNLLIALPVFLIGIAVPYKFWRKMAMPIFFGSLILLIILFIPGLTNDYGSARSWLNIPGLPSIQPSEIMKLGLILYFTLWIESKTNKIATLKEGFFPFAFLIGMIILLIGLQPDFGAVLVISFIAGAMFFVGGGNLWHIFWAGIIGILAAMPIIMTHEYIYKRFLAFWDPQFDIGGSGYQILQALMTIGSGGFWGVGFGQSVQKFGYLPEVQGDTIFAIISEELGFVRVVIFVFVFLFIGWRGLMIANKAKDKFGMLLAVGITSWIVFQAFINISVNLAIMPLTGITLPFVSNGGSSLIMMSLAAGILLAVSREVKR